MVGQDQGMSFFRRWIGKKEPEKLGLHAALLAEIRELDAKQRKFGNVPDTGRKITDGGTRQERGNVMVTGSYVTLHGVDVEQSLYYEAFGIPLGSPPPNRPDAIDRARGIPESCLGSCGRCKVSWKWVDGHSTDYGHGRGLFPLCEKCWSELTPKERLPYYEDLMEIWKKQGCQSEYEDEIREAVLAGK
jgi:hypothetical protein